MHLDMHTTLLTLGALFSMTTIGCAFLLARPAKKVGKFHRAKWW